jgi:hypothetical protein
VSQQSEVGLPHPEFAAGEIQPPHGRDHPTGFASEEPPHLYEVVCPQSRQNTSCLTLSTTQQQFHVVLAARVLPSQPPHHLNISLREDLLTRSTTPRRQRIPRPESGLTLSCYERALSLSCG